MNARILVGFSLLLCALSASSVQDQHAAAREEVNQGVKAYKAANYDEAIQHFENAVRLEPELKIGRLYLATAYAQQYVPGVETSENLDLATKAINQYNQVLRVDPLNVTSAKGIAYLHLQMKRFDEAKAAYRKAIDMDPNDPEMYYSVGVVDWSMAYQEIMSEKSRNNLKQEDSMIRLPACKDLRAAQLANIEDGIAMLARAIELRKNYDDAMVYTNLLYRLRADLQCNDPASYSADIKKANDWADLAMAARQAKAKQQESQQQKPGDTPPN
ncbi:MAG TPA: tetratricopeptide repeat protein [Candidatus Angelobacter sp.]|nr:tetratricopeptide repeat protein [Candidatus Angelobacter sp.]